VAWGLESAAGGQWEEGKCLINANKPHLVKGDKIVHNCQKEPESYWGRSARVSGPEMNVRTSLNCGEKRKKRGQEEGLSKREIPGKGGRGGDRAGAGSMGKQIGLHQSN